MISHGSTIIFARQNKSQSTNIFKGMIGPSSLIKQQFMSFEGIEKQFNVLSTFLEGIGKSFEVYATEMQRKDLEQLSGFLVQLTKQIFIKAKDLHEDKIHYEAIEKQNNDLKQQLRHQKIVNQELTDIKLLFEDTAEKLKQTSQEQSMSKSHLQQLGAMSKELRNQLERKQSKFQMNIQLKNEQLQELKRTIDLLKNQLSIEREKQQDWQVAKMTLNQQIQSIDQENRGYLQKIDALEKTKQQLSGKISQLQFSLMIKVEHSIKNRSINNDSNSAISEKSLQDDHEILKNVQSSYHYQDLKNDDLSSPYLKRQNSVINKDYDLEKRKIRQQRDEAGQTSKIFVRRNTMSTTPAEQLAYTAIKNLKTNKKTFNSSTKLQTAFNRRLKSNYGFRSSGNSPCSISNQKQELVNSDVKNINLKNMLKQQGNSAKNSDDVPYEKLKQICYNTQKQLKQTKRELDIKQKSLQQMQISILDKGDQLTQLQGEIEMCNDRIKQLEYDLQQSKQKQFEMGFSLNQCKKRLSSQQMTFTKQKAKHEEQIQQLTEMCQNFCKQLNISKDQCERWELLCKKLKGQLTQSKTKIQEFEEALSEGVYSKVQNVFERIYEKEKQEVKVYQSPQRVLSRRSSLQNSLRACQTDRVMASNSQKRKQSDQNISAHNACSDKQITSQMLRIRMQSLAGQVRSINNSSNSISPKEEGSNPLSSNERCGQSQQQLEANYQNQGIQTQGENWPSQLSLNIKGTKSNIGENSYDIYRNPMIEQENIEGNNINDDESFLGAFDCRSNGRQLRLINNVVEFCHEVQQINIEDKNLNSLVSQSFCQTQPKQLKVSNNISVQLQIIPKIRHLKCEKVIDETFCSQVSLLSQTTQTNANVFEFCQVFDLDLSYNKEKIIEIDKNSFERQLKTADRDLKNDSQWPSFCTQNIITAEYSNIQTVQMLMESIQTQTQKFDVEFSQQTDNCVIQQKQTITSSCYRSNFQTQTIPYETTEYQTLTDSLCKTSTETTTQQIQVRQIATLTETIQCKQVSIKTDFTQVDCQIQTQYSVFNNSLSSFMKQQGTSFEIKRKSRTAQVGMNNFYEMEIVKDYEMQTVFTQKVSTQSQSEQRKKDNIRKNVKYQNKILTQQTEITSNYKQISKQNISNNLSELTQHNIFKNLQNSKIQQQHIVIQNQKPTIQTQRGNNSKNSISITKQLAQTKIDVPEYSKQELDDVTVSRVIQVETSNAIEQNRQNDQMQEIQQKLNKQFTIQHSTVDFSQYLMRKQAMNQQNNQKLSINCSETSKLVQQNSKQNLFISLSLQKSIEQMQPAKSSTSSSPVYEKLNIKSRSGSTQASPFQSKPNTERSQFQIPSQLRKIQQQKQAEEEQKNSARGRPQARRQLLSPNKQYSADELLALLAGRRGKSLQIKSPLLPYKDFTKEHGWDFKKNLYLLECQKIQINQTKTPPSRCRLILWRKGAIQMQTKKHFLATELGKVIKDKRYTILGNSQIIIELNELSISKKTGNNYFSGNLQDTKYKINNVYICE